MYKEVFKDIPDVQKLAYAIFDDSRNSFMSLLTALYNKDFTSLSTKDRKSKELLSSLSNDEKKELHDILMAMIGKHPILAH